jgi:hypothetical protein
MKGRKGQFGGSSIVNDLVGMLGAILLEPHQAEELIRRFQTVVWEGLPDDVDSQVRDVFGTLAHDLDFYVPAPSPEEGRLGWWSDERLSQEVREALDS